ncbi:hypothetical protein [Streptomyces iconiensis]|uniref:Uncharacterized protein n=1 Tax=Streptomyces iconiensis TaxID=1384038 RepID=A0ABT7A1B1_9ACTN|nr:hypothetical protein [Streptomyces iconiensis]MDJ1135120.1 hypothetical protein [Streptomyces iconiensis]
MSESPGTGSGQVGADYGMFYLCDNDTLPPTEILPDNGLIFSVDGIAVVMTGIQAGPVRVEVEVRSQAPETVDTHAWDEVLDHSFRAPYGQVRVGHMEYGPSDLPVLTPHGAGHYRVRVHARGRDTEPDGFVEEPVEDYLLVVWPQPPEPEYIHEQSDQCGASWRDSTLK